MEKEDKITIVVDDLIERIEKMPPGAMQIGINHYDFLTILYLFKAINDRFTDDKGKS